MREIPLNHPGEILNEDFLKPLDIDPFELAQAIGVPVQIVDDIIHGRSDINADMALRLAAFFGTDAQSWINVGSTCKPISTRSKPNLPWLKNCKNCMLARPYTLQINKHH